MLCINKQKCDRDGICFSVCPVGAVVKNDDGSYEINSDQCIECYACMNSCPSDAITEED